ncbi:MAG: hypothetical protein DRI90_07660 [Deltaproteobacteria bacterium]|nr:MAG: hypothetical protein DRI90_07660 [Deltaproteobacteria bacterium]
MGVATLALGLAVGCAADSERELEASCPPEVAQTIDALIDAMQQLSERAAELQASLAIACANIANDLGVSGVPEVGDGTQLTADEVDQLCDRATAAISDAVDSDGSFGLAILGGLCLVDHNAQLACEASCAPGVFCDSDSLRDRCPPSALWGECPAECASTCIPEPGSTVTCEGECAGICTGSCSGTCGNDCNGLCSGICEGECSGACSVVPATASCPGLCNGGCAVELEEPACAEPLDPSGCGFPSDCECLCSTLAVLGADCSPVTMVVEGNAALKATLEQNLPALFFGYERQCERLLDAAMCLSAAEALQDPACSDQVGGASTTLSDILTALTSICVAGTLAEASSS